MPALESRCACIAPHSSSPHEADGEALPIDEALPIGDALPIDALPLDEADVDDLPDVDEADVDDLPLTGAVLPTEGDPL